MHVNSYETKSFLVSSSTVENKSHDYSQCTLRIPKHDQTFTKYDKKDQIHVGYSRNVIFPKSKSSTPRITQDWGGGGGGTGGLLITLTRGPYA